jgi:hypothetical protein
VPMSFASQVDPSTTTKLPVGMGALVAEPVPLDRAVNVAVPLDRAVNVAVPLDRAVNVAVPLLVAVPAEAVPVVLTAVPVAVVDLVAVALPVVPADAALVVAPVETGRVVPLMTVDEARVPVADEDPADVVEPLRAVMLYTVILSLPPHVSPGVPVQAKLHCASVNRVTGKVFPQ